MRKGFSLTKLVGISSMLFLGLAMPAWAKGKTGGGGGGSSTGCTTVNVNSTLNDQDTQPTPEPFQILSDLGGAYFTKSVSRTNYVKSVITSNCFWTLDTTASTSRSIGLTLSFNLGTAPPADLAGPYPLYVHGRLVTHCTTNKSNTYDVGTMTAVGQTATCPMNLGFYAPDGTWYNLAMNPYNYGGTSQVLITCGGASGGLCNQWTVVPDPASAVINNSTNQAAAIGELLKPSKVGSEGGTQLGEFEVSFSFLIQK